MFCAEAASLYWTLTQATQAARSLHPKVWGGGEGWLPVNLLSQFFPPNFVFKEMLLLFFVNTSYLYSFFFFLAKHMFYICKLPYLMGLIQLALEGFLIYEFKSF